MLIVYFYQKEIKMLKNKYLLSISFLGMVLCCILLITIFVMNIRKEKRYDDIFDDYYIEMNKIHSEKI